MKNFIFLVTISVLCGCLSKMEKNTEETLGMLRESINRMEQLEKGTQMLQIWGNTLMDSKADVSARENAVQSIFSNDMMTPGPEPKYGFEESIYRYFGIHYPTDQTEFTYKKDRTFHNGIPNVAYVGFLDAAEKKEERFRNWTIHPIQESTLFVLEDAIEDLIRKTTDQIIKDGPKDYLLLRTVRLVYVAPAIFAAKWVQDVLTPNVYFRDRFPSFTSKKPIDKLKTETLTAMFLPLLASPINGSAFSRTTTAMAYEYLRTHDNLNPAMPEVFRRIHEEKRHEISELLIDLAKVANLDQVRPQAYQALKIRIATVLKQVELAKELP